MQIGLKCLITADFLRFSFCSATLLFVTNAQVRLEKAVRQLGCCESDPNFDRHAAGCSRDCRLGE